MKYQTFRVALVATILFNFLPESYANSCKLYRNQLANSHNQQMRLYSRDDKGRRGDSLLDLEIKYNEKVAELNLLRGIKELRNQFFIESKNYENANDLSSLTESAVNAHAHLNTWLEALKALNKVEKVSLPKGEIDKKADIVAQRKKQVNETINKIVDAVASDPNNLILNDFILALAHAMANKSTPEQKELFEQLKKDLNDRLPNNNQAVLAKLGPTIEILKNNSDCLKNTDDCEDKQKLFELRDAYRKVAPDLPKGVIGSTIGELGKKVAGLDSIISSQSEVEFNQGLIGINSRLEKLYTVKRDVTSSDDKKEELQKIIDDKAERTIAAKNALGSDNLKEKQSFLYKKLMDSLKSLQAGVYDFEACDDENKDPKAAFMSCAKKLSDINGSDQIATKVAVLEEELQEIKDQLGRIKDEGPYKALQSAKISLYELTNAACIDEYDVINSECPGLGNIGELTMGGSAFLDLVRDSDSVMLHMGDEFSFEQDKEYNLIRKFAKKCAGSKVMRQTVSFCSSAQRVSNKDKSRNDGYKSYLRVPDDQYNPRTGYQDYANVSVFKTVAPSAFMGALSTLPLFGSVYQMGKQNDYMVNRAKLSLERYKADQQAALNSPYSELTRFRINSPGLFDRYRFMHSENGNYFPLNPSMVPNSGYFGDPNNYYTHRQHGLWG